MKFEGKHKKNNQEEDLASYYLPCMDKKKKLVTAIVIFILLATQLDYIDQNITFLSNSSILDKNDYCSVS
jgi:hypothetical protein